MTQSGHIIAQDAQAMHSSGSVSSTGAYPFWLSLVFERHSRFFGQAFTHSPQPLHMSSLNVNFAKTCPFFLHIVKLKY